MTTETRNPANDTEWLLAKQTRDHATAMMYSCYDDGYRREGDAWGNIKDQAQRELETRYAQIMAGE